MELDRCNVMESAPPDDKTLLRRFAERKDAAALEAFFARHADFMYRVALRTVRNPADAEDIVQMAFVRILRHAGERLRSESVTPWLARVVVNVAKDHIRSEVARRGRESRFGAEQEEPESRAGSQDDAEHLSERVRFALDNLPERYRMPVWLHHGEGMAFKDIAAILAVPSGTARSLASRGIEMVRAKMAKSGMTVSAAALATGWNGMRADMAPETLLARVGTIARSGGTKGLSPVAARYSSRLSRAVPVWLKPTLSASVVAAIAVTAGIMVWRERDDPLGTSIAPHVPDEPAHGILYEWDFNESPSPGLFRPILGNWHFEPTGGPDGSGCMRIEPENGSFAMIVHVPIPDSPVAISWQQGQLAPAPAQGHMSRFYWADYEYMAAFMGLVDTPEKNIAPARRQPGELMYWDDLQAYATEKFFLETTDGYLVNFTYMPRRNNARLIFVARGPMRIDNLTIRSVPMESVPDVSAYLQALHAIPAELRDGQRVPVPTLKPGRHASQVDIVFEAGRNWDSAP